MREAIEQDRPLGLVGLPGVWLTQDDETGRIDPDAPHTERCARPERITPPGTRTGLPGPSAPLVTASVTGQLGPPLRSARYGVR
jgi:hypothetical protein